LPVSPTATLDFSKRRDYFVVAGRLLEEPSAPVRKVQPQNRLNEPDVYENDRVNKVIEFMKHHLAHRFRWQMWPALPAISHC